MLARTASWRPGGNNSSTTKVHEAAKMVVDEKLNQICHKDIEIRYMTKEVRFLKVTPFLEQCRILQQRFRGRICILVGKSARESGQELSLMHASRSKG